MTIFFGLELDESAFPKGNLPEGNTWYLGPKNLLHLLEYLLGTGGYPADVEHIRIEQYRQALKLHLGQHAAVFFQKSFEADQFAVATELLDRRDELVLAGWDFSLSEKVPPRLRVIAEIESIFQHRSQLTGAPKLLDGYGDRVAKVLQALDTIDHPIEQVLIAEPWNLLPGYLQRIFAKIGQKATLTFLSQPASAAGDGTDLCHFKQKILNSESNSGKKALTNDGSLLILEAKNLAEAASWIAKILRQNPEFQPICLLPEKNRQLDLALVQEGLPGMGIQSNSLARPSLQILKLAPAFLWEPIDAYKILEFVSLAARPLHDQLALVIGREMAERPGIRGEDWYRAVHGFFDRMASRATRGNAGEFSAMRRQYEFWFERPRYDIQKTAPKHEAREIFEYLENWGRSAAEESGAMSSSFRLLSQQARRIKEILDALPEKQLTYLELERIIRTVYEASPIGFRKEEKGRYPFVYAPGALLGEVGELVWWNFCEREPVHFFSRWYTAERDYLVGLGIELDSPRSKNSRMLFHRSQPVLRTAKRLILVTTKTVDGSEVTPHPLMGYLEAAFSNPDVIRFDVHTGNGVENWSRHYVLPVVTPLTLRQLGSPQTFITISKPEFLARRERESFSSLDMLLYFPYKWAFQYKLRLAKSSILSIVETNTLVGNLAHKLFESLLRQNIYDWDRRKLDEWVDRKMPQLLRREGAVLLAYGREPEKIAFEAKLKYAAWALVSLIQKNQWQVYGTEMKLEGELEQTAISGVADLVLERQAEFAILDLKWKGHSFRQELMRNEEDLQLVLYSWLLPPAGQWAHTGYFILENGKLLARQNTAFREVKPVAPLSELNETHDRILGKMIKTYRWRLGQLATGKIEVRTSQTYQKIEDYYFENGDDLSELLEMKKDDAPFDDFRVLINLVE
jgi:hypothetical protein